MKPLILTTLLIGALASVAQASVLDEQRAFRLAEWTLSEIQHAETALEKAVRERDAELMRNGVLLRLQRIQTRWEQAPHLTGLDKAPYMDCRTAASDLETIAFAMIRGETEWAAYKKLGYRERLEACKDSIQNPAMYRRN